MKSHTCKINFLLPVIYIYILVSLPVIFGGLVYKEIITLRTPNPRDTHFPSFGAVPQTQKVRKRHAQNY